MSKDGTLAFNPLSMIFFCCHSEILNHMSFIKCFTISSPCWLSVKKNCLASVCPYIHCLCLCLCPTQPSPPNSLCSLFFPLCTQCIMTVSPSFPSCSLLEISFDSSLHPISHPLPAQWFFLWFFFGRRDIFSSLLTLLAPVKLFFLPSSETHLAISSCCAESTAITHLHELVTALHR